MGSVASAGVPFFLGFQNRIGVPDCSFMLHQTTVPRIILPEQVNVFDLDTQRATLSATDNKTIKLIRKETENRGNRPLRISAIKSAILKSTTYHADEALSHGFIDRVEQPKLPETGVMYITDQFLATLPG
jgi:ATP-dependent protease ClpP protease subunit